MTKNCSTCAFRDGRRSDLCRMCEVASTHAGSCSGVKYPCLFQCSECFYDQAYHAPPARREEKAKETVKD